MPLNKETRLKINWENFCINVIYDQKFKHKNKGIVKIFS